MKNKLYSSQLFSFAISFCVFIIAAVFGWLKLKYGFNFIDEGWQMTDSWRFTVGDDFFRDNLFGTGLCAATLINSFIFKFYPEITLLGFRKFQFFLTIISLLLLSLALYKINKKFWYQPIIFSIFAFTGLDPTGLMSNLNYFTYPHLFITIHLAFFIMARYQQSVLLKRILYISAGIFLWLISFSRLPLSLVIFSVVLLYFIIKTFHLESFDFELKDLCFVMAPVISLWIIFLGFYGNYFINNVIADAQVAFSSTTHNAGSILSINWDVLKRIIITLPFTIAFLWSTKISKTASLTCVLLIIAITMFAVINTSLFGLITPYYGGWYNSWVNRPLWFSALLASSYFLLLCYFIFKIVNRKPWSNLELFSLVLFIPSIIAAVSGSVFSALGMLVVLHVSIPSVAAIACIILSLETIKKRTHLVQLAILILFFFPFYYTTAWSDWKFTFFDVAPEQANAEIETGFGRGIKTNEIYKNLYDWIRKTSQAYSNKNDYIISYVSTPMVHMIARRRPALSLSNIAFNELPDDYFDNLMELMKRRKRKPQVAYVFEAMPVLVPISLENPARMWQEKLFSFPSDDPISRYVLANMTMIESFQISDEYSLSVRCFIDNTSALSVLKNKLDANPKNPDLNLQLGNFYQKKGDLDNAQKYYQKALEFNPKFIPVLMQSAINQSKKGNEAEAVNFLKKIVTIDPNRIDAYYNIACIYSRQNKIDDSIIWLRKAIDKGFNKWELFQTDNDLNNIRDTLYYKTILKRHLHP